MPPELPESDEPERDLQRLFESVILGVEHVIVNTDSLEIRPIADVLLREIGSGGESEAEHGSAIWSFDRAPHVVSTKTRGSVSDLRGLGAVLTAEVAAIEAILGSMGARLMPAAMHPWMDPRAERHARSGGAREAERARVSVFDRSSHGWANAQRIDVALPFAGDDELGRLHAAVRVALPILPALAASSPYADGRAAPALDYRMEVYPAAARFSSMIGRVIPEPVFTRAAYEGEIVAHIERDLERVDPGGRLRRERLDARGCAPRFDRMCLEIRVLDVQEHPGADVAVAGAAISVVRALVEEHHAGQRELRRWHEGALAEILAACVSDADHAVLRDSHFLSLFGFPDRPPCRASDLWQHLVETVVSNDPLYEEWRAPLETIIANGCLARRLRDAAGDEPDRDRLGETYGRLCDCLRGGEMFEARALLA